MVCSRLPHSPLYLAILTAATACLGLVGCSGAQTCSNDGDCFKGQVCSKKNVCVSADTGSQPDPSDADTSTDADTAPGPETGRPPDTSTADTAPTDTAPRDTAPAEDTQTEADTGSPTDDTGDAPDPDGGRDTTDTTDAAGCNLSGACPMQGGSCSANDELDYIGCTNSCTGNGSEVTQIGPNNYCHCESSSRDEFTISFCASNNSTTPCNWKAGTAKIKATIRFCDEVTRRDFEIAAQPGNDFKSCPFDDTGDSGVECSVIGNRVIITWIPQNPSDELLDFEISEKSGEDPPDHPYSVEYQML